MEQEKNIEQENNVEQVTAMANKNYLQIGAIVVLLLIIAVLWFLLWKKSGGETVNNTWTWELTQWNYEDLEITVYEDKRCTTCPTDEVIKQLKLLPSVSAVEIVRKDFSEKGVSEYLTENDVKTLPLIVFSTNNFDVSKDPVQMDPNTNQAAPKVNTFLQPLPKWSYKLEIWATFNPFEKRSEKGHLLLDKAKLEVIKANSYMKWNKDAKITWLEYSDLECHYCAKLHNAGTVDELTTKYGDNLNIIFNHFPLGFHANAEPAAQILECVAEEKGVDAFYALIKKAFKDEKSTKDYLITEAVNLWANKDTITKCLDSGKFKDKVKTQMESWTSNFWVTGTPWNILINNATWEYEVISGAYPTSAFEAIIDEFLK